MSSAESTDTATVSDRPFETLTERQQALIDELAREQADGLDRTHQEIVDAAAEGQPFDAYSPNYIWEVRKRYGDLIDERAETLLNGHDAVERGNVSVDGHIDLTDPDQFPKPQTFDERPHRDEPDDPPAEPTLTVDVGLDQAFAVLTAGDVPEAHQRAIFDAVVAMDGGGE